MIPGFDAAVMGMRSGETKKVLILADDAYGQVDESMKIEVPREEFPSDINPEPGMNLHMGDEAGNVFQVQVASVGDTHIVVDANHQLAGKDLNFDIEIVSVEEG
jgi:peptidylprolyl isomerase